MSRKSDQLSAFSSQLNQLPQAAVGKEGFYRFQRAPLLSKEGLGEVSPAAALATLIADR
jgi:hypothetical protein